MGFWLLVALIALFIVLILGYVLIAPGPAAADDASEHDIRIYRDQLAELERDVARGVLAGDEAERARIEVSRRLLEADKARSAATKGASAPKAANIAAIAVVALLVAGGGAWLYTDMGAPGYPDYPLELRKELAEEARTTRPSQAEAEAELPPWDGPAEGVDPDYIELVANLRTVVARRPDDIEGLTLLARHEAELGNFRAAYLAQDRLIRTKGDAATAENYEDLAEYRILAAGGYVSPEAEAALSRALQLDPNNGVARYYTGLMLVQTGRPDLAFRIWRALLESSPADAPWMTPLRQQIGDLASMAGVNYVPPVMPTGPGPSSEDIEAAADMSPEDRAAMIQGMVDNLSARLASQGGTPAEWAQLIRALFVLGDTNRATAILNEARQVFANDPEALAQIEDAAP